MNMKLLLLYCYKKWVLMTDVFRKLTGKNSRVCVNTCSIYAWAATDSVAGLSSHVSAVCLYVIIIRVLWTYKCNE